MIIVNFCRIINCNQSSFSSVRMTFRFDGKPPKSIRFMGKVNLGTGGSRAVTVYFDETL